MKPYLIGGMAVLFGISAGCMSSNVFATSCTLEYAPVCGQSTFSGTVMPAKTYGNACMMSADNAIRLYDGECEDVKNVPACEEGMEFDAVLARCIEPNNTQTIVEWAHAANLTRFNTLEDFRYDAVVSRQEAAAFLVRAADTFLKGNIDFPEAKCGEPKDNNDIDPTLRNVVGRACVLQIMKGHQDGKFLPTQPLLRSEAIAVLMRTVDRSIENGGGAQWYAPYIDRANQLGLNFVNSRVRMDTGVTRGELIEWIRGVFVQQAEQTDATEQKPIVGVGSTNAYNGKWYLQSVSTFSEAENKELAELMLEMDFQGNDVNAKMCNNIFGKFRVDDFRIIAPEIATTQMLCQGVTQKAEAAFTLNNSTFVLRDLDPIKGTSQTELRITTEKGVTFTFVTNAQTDKIVTIDYNQTSLEGTWILTKSSLVSASDASGSLKSKGISLAFTGNTLYAKICNVISGNFSINNNTILAPNLASTRMLCQGIEQKIEDASTFDNSTYELWTAEDRKTKELRITTEKGATFTYEYVPTAQ